MQLTRPSMKRGRVNDFAIKLANVNGTGSASANGLLMQAIFRMGIPVSGKNLFPSNIQGLPTWYEIRVNKDGYTARALDYDLMVAMNSQTYARDISEVRSGGYVLYDSSWPLDPAAASRRRDLPRRPARRDVQRELPRSARAHSDEEHRLRRRADRGARHRHGDRRASCSTRSSPARRRCANRTTRRSSSGYDYAREHFACPLPFHLREDGRERRQDPDRRQHGDRARLRLRRRHRRRLVSHHAVHLRHGRVQELLRAATARTRKPARTNY